MRHLAIILAVLVINDAGMEYDDAHPPTVPQVLACGHDNARFCAWALTPNMAGAMGGDGRALLHMCTQSHERQLSPRCKESFK